MNKVILTGNVTKNVELKSGANSQFVGNSIAVKREFKNENGEYDVDFINFIMFGKSAEIFAKYVGKGDKVLIEGKWQTRTAEGKNGTIYINEVFVERFEFIQVKTPAEREDAKPYDFERPKKQFDPETDLPF